MDFSVSARRTQHAHVESVYHVWERFCIEAYVRKVRWSIESMYPRIVNRTNESYQVVITYARYFIYLPSLCKYSYSETSRVPEIPQSRNDSRYNNLTASAKNESALPLPGAWNLRHRIIGTLLY